MTPLHSAGQLGSEIGIFPIAYVEEYKASRSLRSSNSGSGPIGQPSSSSVPATPPPVPSRQTAAYLEAQRAILALSVTATAHRSTILPEPIDPDEDEEYEEEETEEDPAVASVTVTDVPETEEEAEEEERRRRELEEEEQHAEHARQLQEEERQRQAAWREEQMRLEQEQLRRAEEQRREEEMRYKVCGACLSLSLSFPF